MGAIPAADLNNVRTLKHDVQKICGAHRFRQKVLAEGSALDDEIACCLMDFSGASEEEIEELVIAAGCSPLEEIEEILQHSADPNVTSGGRTALGCASRQTRLTNTALPLMITWQTWRPGV